MTTRNSRGARSGWRRLIPLTDHRGRILLPERECEEPLPGSVAMTEGYFGTAWQRFFSDGLWHSCRGGHPMTWEDIISKRNVVLIYDAEERTDRKD